MNDPSIELSGVQITIVGHGLRIVDEGRLIAFFDIEDRERLIDFFVKHREEKKDEDR